MDLPGTAALTTRYLLRWVRVEPQRGRRALPRSCHAHTRPTTAPNPPRLHLRARAASSASTLAQAARRGVFHAEPPSADGGLPHSPPGAVAVGDVLEHGARFGSWGFFGHCQGLGMVFLSVVKLTTWKGKDKHLPDCTHR